jgi:uncharacterized protein
MLMIVDASFRQRDLWKILYLISRSASFLRAGYGDMTITRDEILRKLEENREVILAFGVRRLGIFGSYARGEQREASDMDVLVEFESATFDNYFDLKFHLEDLFARSVDLVIADTIKPRIRSAILEETVYAQGF